MIVRKLLSAIALSWVAICPVHAESGMAAFYGSGRTASGEVTKPTGLTAAHRTLPFGTVVLVTNVSNGKTVLVRIVDRGPYNRGRIIDISRAAAVELDMIDSGTTMVSVLLHKALSRWPEHSLAHSSAAVTQSARSPLSTSVVGR
jgi:peptidoglycan lytic transglycosylase